MCNFDFSYSLFLAKLIGLYLTLSCLAMLLNQQRFKKIFHDIAGDANHVTVVGCVGLIVGLLIVGTHNMWMSDWPVLITVIGWFVLLHAIIRLYTPDAYARFVKDSINKSFQLWTWIWLLIGIYLLWIGFSQNG